MSFSHQLKRFRIKASHWEYWPNWVVYFPVSFYYMYLALKARSLFFFSGSNPSIETGGMFFESKWKIFELMPKHFYPTTIYVGSDDPVESILENIKNAGIQFPFIAKPDRGERGWCVQIIRNEGELLLYRSRLSIPFLVQSYVGYPLEFSVFYFRSPNASTGVITSVTRKQLLGVTGDGKATIEELAMQHQRAFLQIDNLRKDANIDLSKILEKDEYRLLVPYGNHVRGAMFIDCNHIIDDQLTSTFDSISKSIPGFYFGRYDLRCTSIEDLKAGNNISILELNGAGAEPAHIYQPGFSFLKAQRVIAKHYRMMYDAATANAKQGFKYMSYASFKATRLLEKKHKAQAVLVNS